MKIGIDIDGVLRDFVASVNKVYFREYPTHELLRDNCYDLAQWFPIGNKIHDFIFRDHAKEIYTGALPYQNALGFMNKLKKHEVTLVSSQPNGNVEKYTILWLMKYKVPHNKLMFTRDKSDFHGDFLLDDAQHNLERISQCNNSIPVCFDRTWNRDWKGQRIKKYHQFLQMLNK